MRERERERHFTLPTHSLDQLYAFEGTKSQNRRTTSVAVKILRIYKTGVVIKIILLGPHGPAVKCKGEFVAMIDREHVTSHTTERPSVT